MKHSIRISILMVIAIISNSNLFAATRTWTGATNTTFATNTNWSGNTAPVAGDDVIIPASLTRYPDVNANTVALLSITLNGGTLSGNSNITATTITINGGTFTRGTGTLTATTINLSGGTINLSNRTLSTLTYTSGTLTITNGATVTTFNMNGGTFTNSTIQMTIGTLNANGGTFTRGSGTFALANLRLNGGTYTNGSSALSLSGTLTLESGSYGNGTFNLSAGTLQLNGGTFTRGTGTLTLRNLTLNGGAYVNGTSNLTLADAFTQQSGTFTHGAYNLTADDIILNGGTFNAGSGTIEVANNDLEINSGATLNGSSGNINVTGNDFLIASGGTFVGGSGNLTNTGNGDFVIDGTFTGGTGVVSVTDGDFIVNATGTATLAYNKITVASGRVLDIDGDVNFTGTGDINIAGEVELRSAGTLDLNNNDLVVGELYYLRGGSVTNPGDTVKTVDFTIRYNGNRNLNYVVRMSGEMQFRDNAKLTTNVNDLVIFENSAFISTNNGRTPSDLQHIVGPVVKLMSSSSTTLFIFPIGNGNVYAPIQISSYGNRRDGDYFRAEYFSSRNPNAGRTKANTLNLVSQAEYWMLDRGALSGTATTTAQVQLSYNTGRSGPITDAALLRVARWDGSQWVDHGRTGATGNNTSGTLVSATNVTSFSPFTLGSTSSVNPLPVHLLNFTAVPVSSNVNVKWTTTSEINNDYFNVEKSLDGKNWSVIGQVKGAGNTEVLTNYNFVDANPVMGMNYYRLQQNDINGEFTYSSIAPVKFSATVSSTLNIFPMPANNFINVELPGVSEMMVTIYNVNGQKVFEATSGSLLNIDIQNLIAGLYIVEVKADNHVSSTKFIKD